MGESLQNRVPKHVPKNGVYVTTGVLRLKKTRVIQIPLGQLLTYFRTQDVGLAAQFFSSVIGSDVPVLGQ